MTGAARIAQLAGLGQLVLDHHLARLERAGRARQESLDRIAALDLRGDAPDLSPVAAALAEQRYQAWADARRAAINLTLARQTADWMVERDAARLAFGRAEALKALARRKP
jgi:hypothetical protein